MTRRRKGRGSNKKINSRRAKQKAKQKERQRQYRCANILNRLYSSNYYEQNGVSLNHLHRVLEYLSLDDANLIFVSYDLQKVYFDCARKYQKERRLLKWFQMCCGKGLFKFNPDTKCKQFYSAFMTNLHNTTMLATLRQLHRVKIQRFYKENDSPFRFLVRADVEKPLLACSQFLQAQWMLKHIEQLKEAGQTKPYDLSLWKHRILFWFACAKENGCQAAEYSMTHYKQKWFTTNANDHE